MAVTDDTPDSEVQRLRDDVARLEASLLASQAGRVQTTVPEHGGGPGTEISETWSQYEQDLSRQGEHSTQQAS